MYFSKLSLYLSSSRQCCPTRTCLMWTPAPSSSPTLSTTTRIGDNHYVMDGPYGTIFAELSKEVSTLHLEFCKSRLATALRWAFSSSLFSGHTSHHPSHHHGHHGHLGHHHGHHDHHSHHGHLGALDSLPMWQLVGSMRRRRDSTKPTCFAPSWLRRGTGCGFVIWMIKLIIIIIILTFIISEEGEKAENESDGGVYQLRSLSS